MLQVDQPLYLPEGSIRGILALTIVGSAVAGLVPWDVAGIVTAFYFAARTTDPVA
jgi:hypothetical protein